MAFREDPNATEGFPTRPEAAGRCWFKAIRRASMASSAKVCGQPEHGPAGWALRSLRGAVLRHEQVPILVEDENSYLLIGQPFIAGP